MDFTNEFRVGVPVEQAWAALTTLERIAPCMPGAQLTGVEGDEHQGTIKVKVGPVTAQYKGVASFESQDVDAHRAVLVASGRETRGQGNASARIVAQLAPDGDGTLVTVATALTITGKLAQFGRGLIADVSDKLLETFATNLEAELTSNPAGPPPAASPAADPSAEPAGAAAPVDPVAAAAAEPSALEGSPALPGDPELVDAPVGPEAGPLTPGAEAFGPDTLATETVARPDSAEVEAIDLLAVARVALLKRLAPLAVAVVLVAALVVWLLL